MDVLSDEIAIIYRRLPAHLDEIIALDLLDTIDYPLMFGVSWNTKIFSIKSVSLFLRSSAAIRFAQSRWC